MPAWLAKLLGWVNGPPRPPTPPSKPQGPPAQSGDYHAEYLRLLNNDRLEIGKPAMRADRALDMVAQDWADAEASHQTISHVGMAERIGKVYPRKPCAENVAQGPEQVKAVYRIWEQSPGHYRNMMGDYNLAGIGMALDGAGVAYWCANFVKV